MAKNSLRDRVDGAELDLSLSNLSAVPVREIAELKKANQLDLSNNQLKALNDTFCTSLTHLVKIDLSKNLLVTLPSNFGSLKNLQHLDLLGNQLTTLPVSFYQLLKLKWLDVKDNPLDEPLKSVAGDCLNDAQCKKCAQKVVRFLTGVNAQLLKREEEETARKREQERARQAEEAKEKRRKKVEQQAKAEEERRQKAAIKAQQKQEKQQQTNSKHDSPQEVEEEKPTTNGYHKEVSTSSRSDGVLCNCLGMLFALLVVMTAVAIGFHYYCSSHNSEKFCRVYYQPAERNLLSAYSVAQKKVVELYNKALEFTK